MGQPLANRYGRLHHLVRVLSCSGALVCALKERERGRGGDAIERYLRVVSYVTLVAILSHIFALSRFLLLRWKERNGLRVTVFVTHFTVPSQL